MNTEEPSATGNEHESPVEPAVSSWPPPAATRAPGRWSERFGLAGLGAVVSFVVMAVLYGVSNVITIIGLAVICTIGIALIPLFLVCWAIGWVVRAIWIEIRRAGRAGRGGPTVAPGA